MVEITLGDTVVPVIPQKWAYLARHLSQAIREAYARGEGLETSELLEFVGAGAYDVLAALIPGLEKRMSRDMFMDEDTSPTVPEIRLAFRTACEVNEISDLPGMLGKAMGRTGIDLARATALERMAASTDSQISPSTNGDSPSPSSMTTDPTLTESTDSPSPGSPA